MRFISLGYRKVKAVQCYVFLLIWLIIVSIGFYWFLNRSGNENAAGLTQSYQDSGESNNGGELKDISKTGLDGGGALFAVNKQVHLHENVSSTKLHEKAQQNSENVVRRLCNPIHAIKANEENVQHPDFKLEGVIILLRHGDRGPLTHIGHRNVSHINCEAKSSVFEQLTKFATDTVKFPGYSQFIGPFHSFPKVPLSPFCSLGQLSQLGSAQLLTLGKLIRSTYKPSLVNVTSFNDHDTPQPLRVIAYSTRYRRTFQSLFAFLYGLLGPRHLIQSTTIYESQSITFCFKHCSCKAVDRLKKVANKKFNPKNNVKAIMTQLVSQLNSVLGTEKSKKTGNSLLDSLLVYPCHDIELPCHHHNNHKDTKVQLLFKTIKNLSLYNHYHPPSNPTSPSSSCITTANLENLVELINQENKGLKQIPESRKHHLLNSYGLLKEIVNLALRMTTPPPAPHSSETWRKHQQTPMFAPDSAFTSYTSSNNNNRNFVRGAGDGGSKSSRIVIFSGHDTTLQSISAALGILEGSQDIHLPPFGSRLIFEFYRRTQVDSNSPRKLYFRVVYNGVAVTHLVSFCRESENYGTTNSDMNKTAKKSSNLKNKLNTSSFFCPVENLVKYIHDTYFDSFDNATNFKDACKRF